MRKIRVTLCIVLLLAMSIFISFASEEGINLSIKDSYFLESYITGEVTVTNGGSPASGETVTYKLSDYKNTQLIDVAQVKTDQNGKFNIRIGLPNYAKRGLYVLTIRHNDDVFTKEIVIMDSDDKFVSHKNLGSVSVEKGSSVYLPSFVQVKSKRGDESTQKITWIDVPSTSMSGDFIAVGLVDGYYKVAINVHVEKAESNSNKQSSGGNSNNRPTTGTETDEKSKVIVKDEEIPKSGGSNVDFSKAESILSQMDKKSAKEIKNEVKAITEDLTSKINESGLDTKTINKITNSTLNLTKNLLKKSDLTYSEAKELVVDIVGTTVKDALNKNLDKKDAVKVKNEVKDIIKDSIKLAGRISIDSKSSEAKVGAADIEKAIKESMEALNELKKSASNAGIKLEENAPIVSIDVAGSNGDMEVELGEDVIAASKDAQLEVSSEGVTFELDKEVLTKIASISNGNIKVSSNAPNTDLMNKIKSDAKGRKIGIVKDLNYSISGNSNLTEEFMPNIQISVDNLANIDKNKLGVYVYDENTGKFEMVKSKLVNGNLVFKAPHFSVYTVMETDIDFTDMSGHWAKNTVEELAAKGYVSGIDKDKFAPNEKITRAEFVTMLVNVLELKDGSSNDFSDVKSDSWYSSKVSAASLAGLVKGDANGRFNPDSEISRQDMAVLISRAFKIMYGEEMTGNGENFTDNSTIAEYSRSAVIGAKHHGIISGYEDNSFKPQEFASRAEASKMLQNLINY